MTYQALKQLHRLVRFYLLKALAMCMKALNVTCIWLLCRVEPISAAVFYQVFQRNRFIAANYKAHALEWRPMYLMLRVNQQPSMKRVNSFVPFHFHQSHWVFGQIPIMKDILHPTLKAFLECGRTVILPQNRQLVDLLYLAAAMQRLTQRAFVSAPLKFTE